MSRQSTGPLGPRRSPVERRTATPAGGGGGLTRLTIDAAIGAALPERTTLGRARRVLASCASTNDEAIAWARAGAPEGAVVIAETQTRGRGRMGRSWSSPAGEGVYLSLVLRPPLPPAAAPPLTLA